MKLIQNPVFKALKRGPGSRRGYLKSIFFINLNLFQVIKNSEMNSDDDLKAFLTASKISYLKIYSLSKVRTTPGIS